MGFSIVDYYGHFQMNLAACLARLVKRRTGQPTVLGGERDQVDGDRALRPEDAFDHVVDGDGEAFVGDAAYTLQPRDMFVAPSWIPVRFTAAQDLVLFSFSDRGMQRKLGFWRERRDHPAE